MIFVSAVVLSDSAVHKFVFVARDRSAKKVAVAGTFNDWNKDAAPMTVEADGRTWDLSIGLPYGKVQYKFVVNGDDWVTDPAATSVSDGNGHTNSEVLITPPDYGQPASPSDGITAFSALLHRQTESQLNYDRNELQIKFRARPDDLSEVDLVTGGKKLKMSEVARDDMYSTYRIDLPWSRKDDVSYSFELHDGTKTAYYGSVGYSQDPSSSFVLRAKEYKPFATPNWVDGTVVYQIFPDRYADGEKANDPADVQPWGARPTYSNRFGGDAVGVEQHLGYIKSLGIGAVYFTPVFESPSNHRYDTTDYRKVDPQFGTNAEFYHLTKAMHADGIKTVMDFAFNHTSPGFFAFQDIRDKGEASPYLPWYFIKSFPVVVKENPPYMAWDNYPSMPKLNVVNPETEKYILGSVDYWISHCGLDGARLDVANEVNPKLWQDLRTHVKSDLPNFWIVGEEWGDATPWLQGDQWDSTMGYQFREACLGFFADQTTTATEFMGRLTSVYQSYPPQVSRNLMNLIGSHDTPRFLTLCKGDLNRLKLAATVQLTWPGTPSIYYGDELGMEGGVDPDNRRTMDWQAATDSNPTLSYYKLLIHARNSSKALQDGDPVVLKSDDLAKTFAYARVLGDDAALVAVNASRQARTIYIPISEDKALRPLRTALFDIIGRRSYSVSADAISIEMPPQSAAILLPKGNHDLSALQESSRSSSLQPLERTLKSTFQPRS